MAVTNYTPIDDIIDKYKKTYTPPPIKEAEPIAPSEEEKDIKITVEHTELDEEVAPIVRTRKETIEIPPDLEELGVQATETSRFSDLKQIKVPLSDEEIEVGLKQPVTSSFRWLAELAKYLLAQAHIVLKTVHGHVMRVMKS